MKRRLFLKTGIVGGAVLAAGGAFVVWRDVRDADAGTPPRDRAAEILGAIAPVLLAGSLPTDPADRIRAIAVVVGDVKDVISAFPPAIQMELADLFRLLDIRIARRLLTGVSTSWAEAGPSDIAAFLDKWRWNRLTLLRSGYFALHDLVLGARYSNATAWATLGYPGPPAVE